MHMTVFALSSKQIGPTPGVYCGTTSCTFQFGERIFEDRTGMAWGSQHSLSNRWAGIHVWEAVCAVDEAYLRGSIVNCGALYDVLYGPCHSIARCPAYTICGILKIMMVGTYQG